MAIIQEKRLDAPRPEVNETDYGAKYIKAATETSSVPVAADTQAPVADVPADDSPAADADQAEKPAEPVKAARSKKGRPKARK